MAWEGARDGEVKTRRKSGRDSESEEELIIVGAGAFVQEGRVY